MPLQKFQDSATEIRKGPAGTLKPSYEYPSDGPENKKSLLAKGQGRKGQIRSKSSLAGDKAMWGKRAA